MAPKKDTDTKAKATKGSVASEPAAEPSAEDQGIIDCGLAMERIIVFSMDGQRYALPIAAVQEIQQIVSFSEIPDHQAAVVGVINVRGQVVPAVDFRLLVGMPPREYGLQTPMIFVRTLKGLVAMIVDEVEDVIEVPANSTQAPSRMYALADKLLCVVRLESDLVFVFDIDRLIPDEAVTAGGR